MRPASGRGLELIPQVAHTDWMAAALAGFARRAAPAGETLPVVRVDEAGWHIARRLAVPPGVALHRLPPCSPGLQPAEPLWPPVRGAVGFGRAVALDGESSGRCRMRGGGTGPIDRRQRPGNHPEAIRT